MPQILMPKKIIYGSNALDKIRPERFEHTIIISDGGFLESRGFIHSVQNRIKRIASHIDTVINPNIDELYRLAAEIHIADEIDCILAIGSAAVIDCGMILSNESGAEFIAVPVSAACGMTDFESGNYFDYRKSPDCIVLDPALMHCASSGTIAYDGLACLGYAIDALCQTDNSVIQSIAYNGAVGILRNIISAFRGNMDVLEKLMYSMYLAVAAHRNTDEASTSLLTGVCDFFSEYGYPRNSICAVCVPSIIEYESDLLKAPLAHMAEELNVSYPHDSTDTAAAKMLDEIRRIQAALSVSRSVSGFGLSLSDYNAKKSDSGVPSDLLDLCFHGSFKFVRL